MGPIIWLPNGTIKVRPSHSLSHFHIASNQNHFNCVYHLIVFNITLFNVQFSGFMHLVWPTASPLLHRRTKLLLLHQDLPWGSALGHFGADIGSGMHELPKLILVK